MFVGRALLRTARTAAVVTVGSAALQQQHARCGWFSKSDAPSSGTAAQKRDAEIAELRAKLGPLAALDLNGDGKVDAEDAKLAFEAARAKAAAVTDADALLKEVGAHVSAAVATGVPSQISWGFCAGCCAGFVAKKAGKVLAVAVGGVYILMQGLAYNGYITVDHDKISRKFSERFDVNKDGKVDSTDAEDIYKQAMEVLQYNGPSGGGFGAGMILGLRSG